MDVVLEVFDTLLFDRLYANVLPLSPAVASFDPISTISASLKGYHDINATYDTTNSISDATFARSGWQWQPASEYFSMQPSDYAYMSKWDRDNMYRQFVSLYLITWYVSTIACYYTKRHS